MADDQGTLIPRTPAWGGVIPAVALALFLPHVVFGQGDLIFRDGFEAGFVVAERGNPREINIYRADQPNVPIDTIPGGQFQRAIGTVEQPTHGVVYGIYNAGLDSPEIGLFISSTRVVAASQPGHLYRLTHYIPSALPRIVFRDSSGTPTRWSLRSVLLDGTDSRELISGCEAAILVDRESASGVVFRCLKTGVNAYYFTDGVAPAVLLPGPAVRQARIVTADRVIFFSPNPMYHLTTQRMDGTLEEDLIGPEQLDIEETVLAMNAAGRIVVLYRDTTRATNSQYTLWTVNADGSNPTIFGGTSYVIDYGSASPDGSRFTAIRRNDMAAVNDRAWSYSFAMANGDPRLLSAGTEGEALGAYYLDDGKMLVNHVLTANRIINSDFTAGPSVGPSDSAYGFAGTHGSYVLLNNQVTGGFISARTTDGFAFQLSAQATAPYATLREDGYVTFVDDMGRPWIATLDISFKQQIDMIATTQVSNIGDGGGNRIFFVLYRATGDRDIVMFDLDTLTSTTIVGGATDDTGFFFPY